MTAVITHSIESGLAKMYTGLNLAQGTLTYIDEESQMLLSVLNGEIGDGFVTEKFQKCFTMSFDEEIAEFGVFIEEFTEGNLPDIKEPSTSNHIQALVKGMDLAIEGLEEVVIICKEDKDVKKKLKNFSCNGYSPFNRDGFSHFLKNLKGFRKAFLAGITREIGHYKFNQKLEE